ncbi:Ycf66 family protein [Thermosynechococcaceae cyanobacterium BACA0444]|uniref:Ycf66 family protein n=1 Tax=Pseudocalidococcus azoricus BACA0444 TaxID=2918990 RepID=A0AAE4FPT5_9CYAN|nr:Ycf66 family protein [Pseudocalidococcus azoricus]MDS3859891.1 Ycf66 family protein [Pseudocalidococcus azoricus BACA0444]
MVHTVVTEDDEGMLTYLLAWAIAVGSFGLYLTAFFFPELHRKNDLILSGVGLFFALTLWIYADRLRGGLLLGETAAVVLIFWFAWQSFNYRRQLTDPKLKTDDSQAQELWQAIKSVLPGQKSESDGVPTSKIAGQISDWVSKVDLDKLKGQFQGVIKKVPLPTPKSDSPTQAKVNEPDLAEFEETITDVVTETLAEADVPPIESVGVEPEPTLEPPVESIAVEPEATPEPLIESVNVEPELTIKFIAVKPEPIHEPPAESVTLEPQPQDIQVEVGGELAPDPNLEQPEPNHDQHEDPWPPKGTELS